MPLDRFSRIIGVNLIGTFNAIRLAAAAMAAADPDEEGERGVIVNTASIAGLLSAPGMAPYCVSKYGVVAISECLHHDLNLVAPGKVNVSVVCPAWVKTRISDSERNRPSSIPKQASALAPQPA